MFKLGRIVFNISHQQPIEWKQPTSFFLTSDSPNTIINVELIIVPMLSNIDANLIYRNNLMIFYQSEKEDIRYHISSYYKNDEPYAVSIYNRDSIKVYCINSKKIWNNLYKLIWNLIHLETILLEHNCLILHSCYTMYQGEAILFTAPSGTGKTTQANIWKKCYGSRIINGDKCLLQEKDAIWHGCGFPQHGSADECFNEDYPIKAIVIVRQAKENRVEELTFARKVSLLYSECTVNIWDQKQVNHALDIITEICMKVPVIMYHCNMEDDAAYVLHEYLYGEK